MYKFAGKPSDFNVEKSHKATFEGNVVNVGADEFGGESCKYYDPMNRVNLSKALNESNAQLQKASIDTQTGGAGTAGNALIPVYPDPAIVDRTVRETPLRAMFPRRAIKGQSYNYIPKSAQGEAVWAAENGAIADQEDTYARVDVPVKFLYGKGRISGPAIAAMRGFIDPSQLDLASKTKAIREAEEDAIINGDASTTPAEPNGLIVGITTNTTNLSGGLPTLASIRAEFATSFNANGNIDVVVTDVTTHNYVKGLLQDIQRIVKNPSEGMLGFGIPDAFEFDSVMFIKSKFMPRGASAKRMLFLDMRYLFQAVLQELTFEMKYNENDNEPYLLKEYLTPVNTFEGAMTQIYGIA